MSIKDISAALGRFALLLATPTKSASSRLLSCPCPHPPCPPRSTRAAHPPASPTPWMLASVFHFPLLLERSCCSFLFILSISLAVYALVEKKKKWIKHRGKWASLLWRLWPAPVWSCLTQHRQPKGETGFWGYRNFSKFVVDAQTAGFKWVQKGQWCGWTCNYQTLIAICLLIVSSL